jgi:hypothetical protein
MTDMGMLYDQPSVTMTCKVLVAGEQVFAVMKDDAYNAEALRDIAIEECARRGITQVTYTVEISKTGYVTLEGTYDATAVE